MADADAPSHLVFVGMMGSGKTTVGRRVAKRLDYRFVDTDAELEERTGRTVAEWFSTESEAAFRDAESEVLASLLALPEPVVIATGGGAVVRDENRAALNRDGITVVWLRSGPKFLATRMAQAPQKEHRPLLTGDLLATLTQIDEQRRHLYEEVADVIVDIEPVHRSGSKPKKRLAAIVVDALQLGSDDPDAPNTVAST